jgi:diguanylate cyclase (GGDEF)-like protein/PAS domain S-box-containing protein
LFIEHAPAALAMLDGEMRYLAVSHRWLEIHSLVGRDVIGHSHYEVFPNLGESWKVEHRRALAGEVLPGDEKLLEHADGSTQWIRRRIQPWKTGDGEVGGILIFSEDITKQKENEERLRMAASVFTNAREGIVITDANGAILDVNDMFTRITGYERKEVLGQNPRMLKSGLHGEDFYANMWRSLAQDGQWSGELWNRNKNGDVYAEMKTITCLRDASGKPVRYVALFSDITQMKKHAQQLEHVTHYDLLTNLPNRALLADRLQQAMAQAKRRHQNVAVAYLDLDGFKSVNDQHGRDVGDRLLTSLAFNMKCALREGDSLARIGGDEFAAVILDLDDTESSLPILDQLREAAAEHVQIGDQGLRVSASIGVTYYPQSGEVDADMLVRQADQAMYQAKLAGGNRYHIFDPDQDDTVRGRHENLERIRQALAAREFILYYQPKVNMRTGAVVGAEALIRWQHPERGLLPPGMFLPVIEDQPLAIELGEWVIESALAQMDRWREAGLEMPVSVNVGALQLLHADFVDRLSCLLARHPRTKPFSLEIEVLETSALQDVVKAAQVMNTCHAMGVALALDDFGTGYSSLTYLKRLPASILKIDRSFICDMLDDPENLNILEGILGLASAFHREVIAEGVETVEHGLMLLQLGCELAQGYGIARPMPASDLPNWVSVWKPDPRWAQVPLIHSGNRGLLYAGVAHRAWFAAFEAFAQGRRHAPPMMNPRECRFGTWLESERQAGRGASPGFMKVDEIHRAFHELAGEILTAQLQGRKTEGLGRLASLQGMCANLLEHLESYGSV